MNQILVTPFTVARIKQAIFNMFSFKSPGPDGMPPVFLQKLWSIVVQNTKNGGSTSPFSLCNVIVKTTSKCVANRLKSMLDSILSQSQSTFIQAIKLDMSKAYDRVEWTFLHRVLLSPKRGIHQGDPLSLYLFIFCAKVFSYLIQDVEYWGRLTGVAVAPQAPRVSHLLFADDTWYSVRPLQRRLVRGWNAKLLSQAGKGVLVKAVLQSLPTYTISYSKLSVSFLRSLEASMADFWWYSREEKRVHWVAWKKLCRSLSIGGLGFWELREFNVAILAKQGWRILTMPTSLRSRVLKARYFSMTTFGEEGVGSRPSLAGICAARYLLEDGFW
ncbi:UNVERIFIED_CONTAM: putative mitochondrial protein [Sesamum latifolium]|uniref:Mitochondrial protein n=1 Tax=Sesamum latifolium TaxID=2727402 RepID=A0AAW2WSH4_9LAMI